MKEFEQTLSLIAKYGKDLAFIGAIIASIIALLGVIISQIISRLNKRDELRYNSLISMRNAEMKNYVSLIGAMVAHIFKGLKLLREKDIILFKYREELFEMKASFMKCFLNLNFLLPTEDARILSKFNIHLVSTIDSMIEAVSSAFGREDVDEERSKINKMVKNATDDETRKIAADALEKSNKELEELNKRIENMYNTNIGLLNELEIIAPKMQRMIRKYNGLK